MVRIPLRTCLRHQIKECIWREEGEGVFFALEILFKKTFCTLETLFKKAFNTVKTL